MLASIVVAKVAAGISIFPLSACCSWFLSSMVNMPPQWLRAVLAPFVSPRWCLIHALITTHHSDSFLISRNIAIMF